MRVRRVLYERGVLKRYRPEVPCVSVGNVNMGGSGKTPVASWILGWAADKGLTPLLLSRGYKADPPSRPYAVTPESPVKSSGDEPLMLARLHPGARVVVDPQRIRSGPAGMSLYRPDLVVLDDGCQHLAVERDLDLILLRPEDLGREWRRVVPAGRWREGRAALERAAAFLLKVPPEGPDEAMAQAARRRLERYGRPVFPFSLHATGLIRADGRGEALDVKGAKYLLATAVAEPGQVEATAADLLGYPPADRLAFPDHHAFTAADVRAIRDRAEQAGASRIVATSKDASKLEAAGAGDVWCLNLKVRFHEPLLGEAGFPEWWEARWAELAG
jgi:tetraacyldisaccharide 4'-kinase